MTCGERFSASGSFLRGLELQSVSVPGSPCSFRKCYFTALSSSGPSRCRLYCLLSSLSASAVALWVLALMAPVFFVESTLGWYALRALLE